jgi:hypothetical protein
MPDMAETSSLDPVLEAGRIRARALLEAWIARMGGGDLPRAVPDGEIEAFVAGGPVPAPEWRSRDRDATKAAAGLAEALETARNLGEPALLDRLGTRLSLDPVERDCVAFLWALHRTPALAAFAVRASGDPESSRPSARVLGEWVAGSDRKAGAGLRASLRPGGRLCLVAVTTLGDGPDPSGPVSLDDEVTAWLDGTPPEVLWDGRMGRPMFVPADGHGQAGEDGGAGAESVRKALALAARKSTSAWRIGIHGPDGAALERLACAVVSESGRHALVARMADVAGVEEGLREGMARLLRDCLLADAALFLDGADDLLPEDGAEDTEVMDLLADHPGPLVLASPTRLPALFRWFPGMAEAQVPVPGADEIARIIAVESRFDGESEAAVRSVTQRFGLTLSLAREAALEARARSASGTLSAHDLEGSARRRLAARRGRLAVTEDTPRTLDDLFLPTETHDRLQEILANVRFRETVLEDWGFGTRIPHARGVSALFHGPPGTGKTMAAGVIGSMLGLETWRIDLSRIVDKYIGETEKHLAQVFDEARRGPVLLLFDEADSLFAKRTEVQSSTDRYANLEVNYLLQRMERHDGVVVLTTNSEQLLDPAFKRRLRHKVEFPMPRQAEREAMWRGMIPPGVPRDDSMDAAALAADYEMSGGHVRNAVLRACFMAAESGAPLSQSLLRRAADLEYRELGRLVRTNPKEHA